MKQTRNLRCVSTTCALFFAMLSLAGCHSAFVQATVVNQSGQPIHLFEVDYPTASFGGGNLGNGAVFHYRFKILDDGPSKLAWTDAAEHDHTVKGPDLHQGQEGSLTITITKNGVNWDPQLHTSR